MSSQRKHRAARSIEVSGDGVEKIDGPGSNGAERHRVGSDSAVDGRARSRRQFPRHFPDRVRIDAGEGRHGLGREGCDYLGGAVESLDQVGEPVEPHQFLIEQNLGQGQQERRRRCPV